MLRNGDTTTSWLRLLSLCSLLAGCAQPAVNATSNGPITRLTSIKVDNVTYATPAAALAAEQRLADRYIGDIPPETDAVKGTVHIIVPDHDRLRPLVAQITQQGLKRAVGGEALDFLIDQLQLYNRTAANALLKAHAFESGSIVEQNDVNDPAQGDDDYLVWYQVRTVLPNNAGAWIGHWLVRRRGSTTTQQANFDAGTAPGTARYKSFVTSVREAALRLGGSSRAGVTASSLPPAPAAPGSIGSGIIIDTKGHILTDEHVVRGCVQPTVTDTAGHSVKAEITARDGANDIALLSTTHSWTEPAALRDGHDPRLGDGVVVAGYPLGGLLGSGLIVTTGSLSALSGLNDDSRMFQISAPIQPGDSGGPVLDQSGHLLGMVSATLNSMTLAAAAGIIPQNVNFALKTVIIQNFLQMHQIDYAHGAPANDLQSGEVGELARKFTVRVDCGKP